MPVSAARARYASTSSGRYSLRRQGWGAPLNIWIASAPISSARPIALSTPPAVPTCAPIFMVATILPQRPLRLASQLGAEVRVGHGDQLLPPLAVVLAHEPGDTVLRNDRIGEEAGQGDDRAGFVLGDDAGDGTVQRRRWQQGDSAATAGDDGADVRLRLAAGAVDHPWPEHALRVNLADEVHREGVVHGVEVIVLGDVPQVEHVLGVVHLELRVLGDDLE